MQQATDGSQPTAAWQRVETLGVAQIVVYPAGGTTRRFESRFAC